MITQERLKELLHYNPETGLFIRRLSVGGKGWGTVAGTCGGGRSQIQLDGKLYRSHRLAVFYMTGEWPPEHVDHINGDASDNRWCNLRLASNSKNNLNTGLRKDNTSGHKNIDWYRNRWRVQVAGHQWLCKTLEEAVKLARKMREHYHGEFVNHGETK